MPGDEIGVEMRQEYVLNLQGVLGDKRNVLVGVPLRVDHGCRACRLVSNNVGSVRQTRQIELLEDQVALTFFAESCVGWGTIRRYGRGALQPLGYICLSSSSVTAGRMITSS